MEVILITPNPKYQTLVNAAKVIEANSVDICTIIETQVFLNHHPSLSFYCIRNNFPYQFHQPLKISKHLLDRNEGAVQLFISNGLYFKIQAETDTLDILSNVQNSLQGVQNQQNIVFTLRFWDIQIRLVILNQVFQQHKVKDLINQLQSPPDGKSTTSINNSPELSKIILYIDENNCEDFLSWTQNQNDFYDFQLHERLSKQYMTLKQEIDNQKNSFRNKIKMVQTILGENINIDKLLNEEKQQNQEYKRLKETFETIKNIDNVIIEQQKKIEAKTQQLKQKRASKHSIHYENARMFSQKKKEISELIKQIEQLKYKVNCVSKNKAEYLLKSNYEPSSKVKQILNDNVNKCKDLIRKVSSSSSNFRKSHDQNQESIIFIKDSIESFHKKNVNYYKNQLKKRSSEYAKQVECAKSDKKQEVWSEVQKYQDFLRKISSYCSDNQTLLKEIQIKTGQKNNIPSYNTQQFVILSELLEQKIPKLRKNSKVLQENEAVVRNQKNRQTMPILSGFSSQKNKQNNLINNMFLSQNTENKTKLVKTRIQVRSFHNR